MREYDEEEERRRKKGKKKKGNRRGGGGKKNGRDTGKRGRDEKIAESKRREKSKR